MRKLVRRAGVAVLFAALVLALLWFQGLVLRPATVLAVVPPPPSPPPGAETALVELAVLRGVREVSGFVEPIDPVTLSARVMASVRSVGAREGDDVAAGTQLLELDDRDAAARLAQARAAEEAAGARELAARLAYERAERLLRADALTPAEWEAARAARDEAAAELARAREAAAEAETALSWFQIDAPADLRVLERRVDPGSLAAPGAPLLVLYRPAALRFAAAVPEDLGRSLEVGAEVELALDGLRARPARVTRVLPGADPRSGTVTVHLAPETASDLRPGLLGRIAVPAEERQVLLVPAAAVRRVGQIELVEVVRDGRVRTATVRTGKPSGARVEVLSGLSAGDEVVLP